MKLSYQWASQIRWAPVSKEIVPSVGVSDQMDTIWKLKQLFRQKQKS